MLRSWRRPLEGIFAASERWRAVLSKDVERQDRRACSQVQLADLVDDGADARTRIEGGAFLVNSGGLAHYERYGRRAARGRA